MGWDRELCFDKFRCILLWGAGVIKDAQRTACVQVTSTNVNGQWHHPSCVTQLTVDLGQIGISRLAAALSCLCSALSLTDFIGEKRFVEQNE